MNGWVKLHRKMMEWEWYDDSQTVHLFLHLLFTAAHKDGNWRGIPVKRGQVIFGRKRVAAATGISERAIRTRLLRLKTTNELTIETTNRCSVITILKYNEYQTGAKIIDQQNDQQTVTKTSSKTTTSEEVKKLRSTTTSSGDEGEVTEEKYLSQKGRLLKGTVLKDFNHFWNAFSFKKGRADAADAFLDVYRPKLIDNIIDGAKREAQGREALIAKGRSPKWAQGWLSGRRWEDEPLEPCGQAQDCNRCQYNQDPTFPCKNLSLEDFNPSSCKSFRTVGGA